MELEDGKVEEFDISKLPYSGNSERDFRLHPQVRHFSCPKSRNEVRHLGFHEVSEPLRGLVQNHIRFFLFNSIKL